MLNNQELQQYCDQQWESSIVPALIDFIKIPNKSPLFDKDWQEHGFMQQAVNLLQNWANENAVKNMQLEVVTLPERTPLIFIEIPGQTNSTSDDTILLYGHMDKQPEMVGWDDDLGPWKPVRKNEKLYGRGGADDGYALFASLTAIKALQQQNIPHSRCVIIIEACEESGSYDLPFYIDHLKEKIGEPSLIICLDSGAGNYQQLWSTTSLRGVVNGDLKVEISTEGVHSGAATGIVPSSFRIARQLLNRIEDENTGEIKLPELHVDIPQQRIDQAKQAADILDQHVYCEFPFVNGAKPVTDDLVELILNRTWKPTLEVTGVAGIPNLESAGNVLRPQTTLKLSFRLPPTSDVEKAGAAIKKALEQNPPYNAKVSFALEQGGLGWNAPEVAPWLIEVSEQASQQSFGKSAAYMGEGGSIPFMGMLGEKFPQAQFLITGVLGPHSNAHGPNEFIHIEFAKKLTACVAHVIAKHHTR